MSSSLVVLAITFPFDETGEVLVLVRAQGKTCG
jgi:hypothetical protein